MLKFRRFYASGRETFGDFFGSQASQKPSTEPTEFKSNKDLRLHPKIHEKLHPAPQPNTTLLSPLKQQLYRKIIDQHGEFKNNQIVDLEGARYRLHLTPAEIQAMEPSVYCESYRIKSSWKKTYMFLRMFRRMGLTDAINQCHFSAKALGRDVGEMLTRAKSDAESLGMDPENLVIEHIWVGKDGHDRKRVHVKGRGRAGIINHPYVHVKAILRDQSYFDAKEKKFKEKLDKKVWEPLRSWKIKEEEVQSQDYKW